MGERYKTKKEGKTEVYPFWNMDDIRKVVQWFEDNEKWDGYLISMLELLLGRRISDTVNLKWSDFYYENGTRKREMDTVEEIKTDKTIIIPLEPIVFEVLDKYCEKTDTNPMQRYNEFIFMIKAKREWIERKHNFVYSSIKDIDEWIYYFGKDYGEKRKHQILKEFSEQRKYINFGDYLYNVVEFKNVTNAQTNEYRKLMNKAVEECGLDKERLSTHSWRKSFGHWIYKMHQFDPSCLITLQTLFGHSSLQQTEKYIGLSTEKTRQYMADHGEFVRNVLNGNGDEVIKNSPVVSLKTNDFNDILKDVIEMSKGNASDLDVYNWAVNEINNRRIS